MIPLSEHYALKLIEELSKQDTRLSSVTVARLLRILERGGHGWILRENTLSEGTANVSTTPGSVTNAIKVLDSMRGFILSESDVSMDWIQSDTHSHGGKREMTLTMTALTMNEGGRSEHE